MLRPQAVIFRISVASRKIHQGSFQQRAVFLAILNKKALRKEHRQKLKGNTHTEDQVMEKGQTNG